VAQKSFHSKAAIEARVREIWRSDRDELESCLAIIQYLAESGNTTSFIYPNNLFSSASGLQPKSVLTAAKFFSGTEVPLLEMKFQFIDDLEDESSFSKIEYSVPEVNRFCETGEFEHPRTGKLVPGFQQKMYMFFVPTALTREVLFSHGTKE
jgi:hypothetical protein